MRTHTHSECVKPVRGPAVSKNTSLLVSLENFRSLTPREANARHLYLQGEEGCGGKAKRHMWGHPFYGADSDMDVLRQLFPPPNADPHSASLWLWVTRNVFSHKKAAREARNFIFLSHLRAWRDILPPNSHLVGEGRQTSHASHLP